MTDLDNNYILIYKPTIDKYTMYSVYEPNKILETLSTLDDALEMMVSYIKYDALTKASYHDH